MLSFSLFPKIVGGFVGRNVAGFPFSSKQIVQLKQVHSDRIHHFNSIDDPEKFQRVEGDAIISSVPKIPIAVRVADCTPILIASPSGILAAVHAGWRGTQAQIVFKTILEMKDHYPIEPSHLKMVIGPAICDKCYEIGEEVAQHFQSSPALQRVSSQKFKLDLKHENYLQALQAGVLKEQIEICPECTLCDEDRFFSYRGSQRKNEENNGRNFMWVMREN